MNRHEQAVEKMMCEEATGCSGAGDYRKWSRSQGYPHCAVVDWTSSAGDWTFLVSKDGHEWVLMTQTNQYPRAGFDRIIDEDTKYYGTEQEALKQVCDEMTARFDAEARAASW
jgi:hypothetical protein